MQYIYMVSLIFACFFSSPSLAANFSYSCEVKNSYGVTQNIWFAHTELGAYVYDELEDVEYFLDRQLRLNEEDLRFAIYAENNYDGYGGYVKLSIPREVATAESMVTKSFVAYLKVSIYSELGHISTEEIKTNCKPATLTGAIKDAETLSEKISSKIPSALWYSEDEAGWGAFYSYSSVSEYSWNNDKISDALLAGNEPFEVWSQEEVVELISSLANDENLSPEERNEYAALLVALKKELVEFKGFKIGKPDSGILKLIICGRNSEGYLVGVQTLSVET